MKFKGLTKLALSGVALAAVAATLGTSTYAWYVSNSTATVGGLDGATAGSEQGNVMVCQLTENSTSKVVSRSGNWGNKLTSVELTTAHALSPVSKDVTGFTPTGTDVTATGWHDKDLAPVAADTAYAYYAFGLWSTEKTSIDMKFGAKNNTTTYKYQTAYATGNVGGKAVNATFTVDAMNALRVEVFQYEFSDATDGTEKMADIFATESLGTYCPADAFYNDGLTAAYASPTINDMIAKGDNTDANAYYAQIMNENPKGGYTQAATDSLSSATKNITIGTTGTGADLKTKKYIIVLRYWLEGTDKECFDSCIGQTFSFNVEFTVHPTTGA